MEAPITQDERTVLRAIAELLDTKPPTTPQVTDLVRATGLPVEDVREAVRSLERLDYIVIDLPELGGDGSVARITRTGQHHLTGDYVNEIRP